MRFAARPQHVRIRRILEMVREGMARDRLPNAVDFCRMLEVSRPTVMRDLDYLRDDERAPLEYVPERHGYRLTEPGWQLPAVSLSRREVFSFAVARKLLTAFRGTPLEADMESVLRKIGESMPGHITVAPGVLTDHLTVVGEDYVKVDPGIWTAMASAVDARERIVMRYQKSWLLRRLYPRMSGNGYGITGRRCGSGGTAGLS